MRFNHSCGFSLTMISTINTFTDLGLQVHHWSLQRSINWCFSSLTLRIPNSSVLTFLCVIVEFILLPYLLVIPLSYVKPFEINDKLYSQQTVYSIVFITLSETCGNNNVLASFFPVMDEIWFLPLLRSGLVSIIVILCRRRLYL